MAYLSALEDHAEVRCVARADDALHHRFAETFLFVYTLEIFLMQQFI